LVKKHKKKQLHMQEIKIFPTLHETGHIQKVHMNKNEKNKTETKTPAALILQGLAGRMTKTAASNRHRESIGIRFGVTLKPHL